VSARRRYSTNFKFDVLDGRDLPIGTTHQLKPMLASTAFSSAAASASSGG
jgi:hypothetical protein